MTGSGTRVTATSHTEPHDSQTNASALVETVSKLDRTGSGPKTATGTAETARGQKGNVTNPIENAFIHKTVNSPWIESATRETSHTTPQTANGHNDALHENLDLTRRRA